MLWVPIWQGSHHRLYLGADNITDTKACIGIWNPFLIIGCNPLSNDSVIALACEGVPLYIHEILLEPYDTYENLFHFQDDSSLLANQGDPGLFGVQITSHTLRCWLIHHSKGVSILFVGISHSRMLTSVFHSPWEWSTLSRNILPKTVACIGLSEESAMALSLLVLGSPKMGTRLFRLD